MPVASHRQQQWSAILDISRKLKQEMAEENWQQMVELESKRGDMLKDFFETPVSAAEAASIAAGIKQVMQSDNELIEAGREKQKELSSAVQKLSSNRKAIKAYNQVQK